MKKKLLALCALTLVGTLGVALTACNKNDDKDAASFVSLDINPSIELTLDSDNKVISAYGANEDGQVLLYGEDGIVGMNVESAVDKITSLAIELGYISEDNKVVQTSVSGNVNTETLKSSINAQISSTAARLNFSVTTGGSEAYSLLRKLEKIKEQYPDNEAIQALTPDKLKLVISASEAGDITIEVAAELDTAQLVKLVSDAHENAKEFATEAYNKATVFANNAYDKAVGLAMDGIYTTYYLANHPLNAYYGIAYQGFKTSARGLNAVADALEYIEEMEAYALDEATVTQVAQILGVSADDLKNANGDITLASIEAYADKTFKNSPASEEVEQLKEQLSAALDSLESNIQTMIAEAAQVYAPQIESLKSTLNSLIDMLPDINTLLPGFATGLQNAKNDLNDVVTELTQMLSDTKLTSAEVRALANTLENKSNAALEQIENDLTDEDLENIAQLQQNAKASLDNAKAQLDSAIASAGQEAKQYLENLKAQRTTLNA